MSDAPQIQMPDTLEHSEAGVIRVDPPLTGNARSVIARPHEPTAPFVNTKLPPARETVGLKIPPNPR